MLESEFIHGELALLLNPEARAHFLLEESRDDVSMREQVRPTLSRMGVPLSSCITRNVIRASKTEFRGPHPSAPCPIIPSEGDGTSADC
jgi:hypothetical protein